MTLFLALTACKSTPTPVPAMLSWDEAPIDFGTVGIGETETRTFTLANQGGTSVDVLSALIIDGDRDIWSVVADGEPLLAPSASLDLVVSFSPEDDGDRYGARLHVRTDLPDVPGIRISLSGTGAPSAADADGDGVSVADGDCDDSDPDIFPGANERCNGRDDDCNGNTPGDEADDDGDGVRQCNGDCDDTEPLTFPGNPEVCDGVDNDCDPATVEGSDLDGDGITNCEGDCDDGEPSVGPGFTEVCGDGLDNDCEGTADSLDADEDGSDACAAIPDCDDGDPTAFPLFVDPAGDDTATGVEGSPLSTLGAALANVNDCASIHLAPGTYTGATGDTAASITGLGALPEDVQLTGPGRILDLTGGPWQLSNLEFVDGDTSGNGAAIRLSNGDLTLTDVSFRDNSASAGGAIAATNSSVALLSGVSFEGNAATTNGGAVHLAGGSFDDVGGTIYVDDTAGQDGGAIHSTAATRLVDVTVRNATAAGAGGAVSIAGGTGHEVLRGTFLQNQATSGGALSFAAGTTSLRNTLVAECTATTGGAVSITGGDATVRNNTFAANSAPTGAALTLLAPATGTISSNLAHFNEGDSGFHTDLIVVNADHNTVFGTTGTDYDGLWVLAPVSDNRSENPGFASFSDNGDPDDDDLSLSSASPSIDSGDPAPAFNDSDGTRNDRGSTGGPGAL